MKKLIIVVVIISVLVSTKSMAQISDQIIGTWTLVSMKYEFPDGNSLDRHEFKFQSIKIFTKNYYSYGSQNDGGFLQGAGGGKYEITGDTLIEHHNYSHVPEFMGNDSRIRIRIEGNKLFQSGTLPNGLKIKEEYIRLE